MNPKVLNNLIDFSRDILLMWESGSYVLNMEAILNKIDDTIRLVLKKEKYLYLVHSSDKLEVYSVSNAPRWVAAMYKFEQITIDEFMERGRSFLHDCRFVE